MMLTVTVTDGTRDLTMTFFQGPHGHERAAPARATGLFAGKVAALRGRPGS